MTKISRRELRKMISESLTTDPDRGPMVIDMSSPMAALRAVMSAIGAGRPFMIKVSNDTMSAVGRVFNIPVESDAMSENVHPGLIIAGVAMVILLGLVAYAIHQGYGVRLRGGGGIGGDVGPQGEGEVIFAPGGQEIPDTSMGKEPEQEESALQQKSLMGMM